MGSLYKLDFSNGKSYIGISSNPGKRFSEHKRCAIEGRDNAVYRAWRKHGEPTLTLLAVVEDKDLAETEIRAIKVFNTLVPNGYNVAEGGSGGSTLNDNVSAEKHRIRMIGNSNAKGLKHSDSSKAKISERSRSLWTEERKKKNSEAMKGNTHNKGKKLSPEKRSEMSRLRTEEWARRKQIVGKC